MLYVYIYFVAVRGPGPTGWPTSLDPQCQVFKSPGVEVSQRSHPGVFNRLLIIIKLWRWKITSNKFLNWH